MSSLSNYFVHTLLRARDWQHRPQLDQVCDWWRDGGRGVCALVGMGGAGKTAIAQRFLRVLPGGLPADPDVAKDASLPEPHSVFVFSFYDAPNPEAFFESLQMWLENTPRVETVLSVGQMLYLLQQTPGLLVLDGLEKVQEDGLRGTFGRLSSPKLRDFLDQLSAGYVPELSVLVTSRFPLADLRDARPQFFQTIAVEEIDVATGVQLLRDRGVQGTDLQLEPIVEHCGRHALTVDFAGGYIKEYGDGDPATPLDLGTAAELDAEAEREPDDDKRAVLKQGIRFARISQRYREAMLASDEAAITLLERICLFRLGVDCETLAAIFTGPDAEKVSGKALAGLDADSLQKKLDWLVRMRIVEQAQGSGSQENESDSSLSLPPSSLYTIHPAVRDGFLSGISRDDAQASHEAVRQGLEVSLGEAPGENPSDPATLDLLEEIVHHTLRSGHIEEAWGIYENRIGAYGNLGTRLGDYERGERICRAFAADNRADALEATGFQPSQSIATSTQVANLPYHELSEHDQGGFINDWALYLSDLGRLAAAARCHELVIEIAMRLENWKGASVGNRNLCDVWMFSGRLSGARGPDDRSVEQAKGALASAGEALRLAELADDAWAPYNSHAFRAQVRALRGDIPAALADFSAALGWQHKHDKDDDWPLHGVPGIQHTQLLSRLGSHQEAKRLTEANLKFFEEWGEEIPVKTSCRLILSALHIECSELSAAESLCAASRAWAEARDAKEVLTWSALVQARIELTAISYQDSDPKGQRVKRMSAADASIDHGLKIARDCGYGLFHIDLLLERARLHLFRGDPARALEDIELALDRGIPADDETGQPQLLAANDEACGYAWAIPAGLELRAQALLLQAAQTMGADSYVPAKISELTADVRTAIDEAKQYLNAALDRWHNLRDPDPTEDNNFTLDGKEYNYRAADTHQLLTQLDDGVLTRYPLVLDDATEEKKESHSAPDEGSIHVRDLKGRIDIGILTIRDDEFQAVLDRLPGYRSVRGKRFYNYARVATQGEEELSVAVTCLPRQGQLAAHVVADDMIEELGPPWLFLVGIGGGIPDGEYSLGDVVVANRLNDFCVWACLQDKPPEFSMGGGSMHVDVEAILANLIAFRELKGWNTQRSVRKKKPTVEVPDDLSASVYYGSEGWRNKVQSSLRRNFPKGKRRRAPKLRTAPVSSSDALIKSADLAEQWQQSARSTEAVEMELAGVYSAARYAEQDCRVVAIRGLSDIIGFKRSGDWTAYACHSAAAFALALIKSGIIKPREDSATPSIE